MATVLWGARRGDVQYAGRDWRRRNIPVGAGKISLVSMAYYDVGDMLELTVSAPATSVQLRVVGIDPERGELGCVVDRTPVDERVWLHATVGAR